MPIEINAYYDRETERAEFHGPDRVLDTLQFQHGIISENGVNGVTNEAVLEALLLRMAALQEKLPCRENALAITNMQQALMWLQRRTRNRVEQGVEDSHEPHRS